MIVEFLTTRPDPFAGFTEWSISAFHGPSREKTQGLT